MSITKQIKVTCEGPSCLKEYVWQEGDENNAPKGIWRILAVTDMANRTHQFCSTKCMSEWGRKKYTPLKSPKEMQEEAEAAQKKASDEIAKKLAEKIDSERPKVVNFPVPGQVVEE